MTKLIPIILAGALLLPALPGGAQTPTSTPTGTSVFTQQQTAAALTFAGRGLTDGLSLTIGGQGLQSGVTATRVANAATDDCAGVACARAAGLDEPLGEAATATSPGDPGPNEVQQFSITEDLSPELGQVVTGTVDTSTAQTSDAPSATGTAGAVTLDVTLTQTVVSQLPPEVTEPLTDGLGQLGDALAPITENDPTGIIAGLTDTLDGLVDDLAASPLARIQAGQSTSTADFADGVVAAEGQAAGAVITLIPTPESTALLPEGLAVIEVGPSRAAATANGTDRATTDAAASIARITLLPGVLDDLPGLDPGAIEELPLDEVLELLPPEVTDLLPVDDLLGLLGNSDGPEGTDEPTEPSSEESTDEQPAGDDTVTTEQDPVEDAAGDAEGNLDEGAPAQPADGTTGEEPAAEQESGDEPTDTTEQRSTPIEDAYGDFMQADENSGGFVIDLETGTEPVCILEDTPLETCVTLGGTSETFTEDGLGVGVLAAGVEISAIRGAGEFTADDAGAEDPDSADSGARTHAKAAVAQNQVAQATGPGLLELVVGRSEAGVAAAFVSDTQPDTTPQTTPLPQTGGSASLVLPSLLVMVLSGLALASVRRRRP